MFRFLILFAATVIQPFNPASGSEPRAFLLDGPSLVEAKRRVAESDGTLEEPLRELRSRGDAALKQKPLSVVNNDVLPPSGDPHDYMSIGPYWWPDPNKDDGLPYIRKDGQVNPERRDDDSEQFKRMQDAVETLATAYYLTDHEPYAEHAALLLRTWFLDEATRMNPHLEFGQAIPGRCTGRGIGIIDTAGLPKLIDAIGLLEASAAWTDADQRGMVAWFDDYLSWMRTSRYGIDESKTLNNHATWYDAQVAAFALFVGKDDVARETLEAVGPRRLATQIESDGRQPHELARTKAFSYSAMNLRGFVSLAELGRHVDVDLWRYEAEDGRGSIRRAIDWLLPYATESKEFPYKQISGLHGESLVPILRRAAIAYDEPSYEKAIRDIPGGEDALKSVELIQPGKQKEEDGLTTEHTEGTER